nr:hypothetical protein Iba_chr11dCG10180 [Ipomoea batatas]
MANSNKRKHGGKNNSQEAQPGLPTEIKNLILLMSGKRAVSAVKLKEESSYPIYLIKVCLTLSRFLGIGCFWVSCEYAEAVGFFGEAPGDAPFSVYLSAPPLFWVLPTARRAAAVSREDYLSSERKK